MNEQDPAKLAELYMAELYTLMRDPPSAEVWGRFVAKVSVPGWSECWIWRASFRGSGYNKGAGYPAFVVNGVDVNGHRQMAQWLYGKLPRSLVVDHVVCSNTRCVNPLHLIPHSQQFNMTRTGCKNFAARFKNRTHCDYRHEFTELNTRINADGSRRCRKCDLARQLKRYATQPAVRAASIARSRRWRQSKKDERQNNG